MDSGGLFADWCNVSQFSGAAPEPADKRLFEHAPKALAGLQKQSRKELRQKARAIYWDAKQKAKANA